VDQVDGTADTMAGLKVPWEQQPTATSPYRTGNAELRVGLEVVDGGEDGLLTSCYFPANVRSGSVGERAVRSGIDCEKPSACQGLGQGCLPLTTGQFRVDSGICGGSVGGSNILKPIGVDRKEQAVSGVFEVDVECWGTSLPTIG
jgi:hypothetical protein